MPAQLHPLQRLAIETPEQLEPFLRRIAFKLVRRRVGGWLRRDLAIAVNALERLRRAKEKPADAVRSCAQVLEHRETHGKFGKSQAW